MSVQPRSGVEFAIGEGKVITLITIPLSFWVLLGVIRGLLSKQLLVFKLLALIKTYVSIFVFCSLSFAHSSILLNLQSEGLGKCSITLKFKVCFRV